jgi:hypothetical protein
VSLKHGVRSSDAEESNVQVDIFTCIAKEIKIHATVPVSFVAKLLDSCHFAAHIHLPFSRLRFELGRGDIK